jgi:hypothetical protein
LIRGGSGNGAFFIAAVDDEGLTTTTVSDA